MVKKILLIFIIHLLSNNPNVFAFNLCKILVHGPNQNKYDLSIGSKISLRSFTPDGPTESVYYFLGKVERNPDTIAKAIENNTKKDWFYFLKQDGTIEIIPGDTLFLDVDNEEMSGTMGASFANVQKLNYIRKQTGDDCATQSTMNCFAFLSEKQKLPTDLEAIRKTPSALSELENVIRDYVSLEGFRESQKIFMGAAEQVEFRLKVFNQYPNLHYKFTTRWDYIDANLSAGYPVIIDTIDQKIFMQDQDYSFPIEGISLTLNMKSYPKMTGGHSQLAIQKIGQDWILIADSGSGVLKVVPTNLVKKSLKNGYATIVSGSDSIIEPSTARSGINETFAEIKARVQSLFKKQ